MKVSYVKRPLWERPLFILQGIAHLLEGIILIVSFGFIIPSFVISIAKLRTQIALNKLKRLNYDQTN